MKYLVFFFYIFAVFLLAYSSFIDDSSVIEGNTPSTHAALDRTREDANPASYTEVLRNLGARSAIGTQSREVESVAPGHDAVTSNQDDTDETRSADTERVPPFFPAGLAVSQEQPTQFNFNLFVLDSLTLPRGLFAEDERQEVHFEDAAECTAYCERYVQERLQELPHSRQEDHSEVRRARLNKEDMFHQSGEAIQNMMTGNGSFDANLNSLRVDVYGNVMLLSAPQWSDLSPQFTHGFPRRLVREDHRGLTPGNLTVAARISNQGIRSLAVGDVACFLSRKMVHGLGLTTSELVLARSSAVKYAGRKQKPSRLIDMMLRFGVDFLTMKSLTHQQVSDLRGTSTIHWNQILSQEDNADHSESESSGSSDSNSELEVPASWDIRQECGDFMPGPSEADHSKSVRSHIRHLLTSYVSATVQPVQATLPATEQATRAKPRSSGQRRKRNRKTTGPTMPVIPSVQTRSQEETPRADPRSVLLALEGIVPARIPKDDSLERLTEFLRAHQPLASEVT